MVATAQRAILVAVIGVTASLVFSTVAAAQGSNSCLGCDGTNVCKAAIGNACCCTAACQYIQNPGPPPVGTLTCSCTKWCLKCGSCTANECRLCSSSNRHEPATTVLASNGPVVDAVARTIAASDATFTFTAAAESNLAAKSPLAAAILRNLTTRCGGKDRVTLGNVSDSPFDGGVTTTTIATQGPFTPNASVKADTKVTSFIYSGRLSIVDRKAILEITLPPGIESGALRSGPTEARVRVEVAQDGTVSIGEPRN